MHLDEEQVQRLRRSELAPGVETTLREHLEGCAQCRAQVAESEREQQEVEALFRHLDHAPPRLEARDIARQARRRDTRWIQWAAGIALALGLGGASYAIPGSPVPAWIQAAAQWIGGGTDRSASRTAPSPSPVAEPTRASDSSVAGIAVAPGQALAIAFTSALGRARLSLTEGTEVVVRAPAGAAVFTSHVDRLVIDNSGSSATFEVEIPRTAPRVELRVGERRIFLKEGPRISTDVPVDSSNSYLLPLTPQGP